MNVCIYACMHVCMYVCMNECMYVCMYRRECHSHAPTTPSMSVGWVRQANKKLRATSTPNMLQFAVLHSSFALLSLLPSLVLLSLPAFLPWLPSLGRCYKVICIRVSKSLFFQMLRMFYSCMSKSVGHERKAKS